MPCLRVHNASPDKGLCLKQHGSFARARAGPAVLRPAGGGHARSVLGAHRAAAAGALPSIPLPALFCLSKGDMQTQAILCLYEVCLRAMCPAPQLKVKWGWPTSQCCGAAAPGVAPSSLNPDLKFQVSLYADWVAWLPAEPEDGEARGMRGHQRTEQRARQGPSALGFCDDNS